jgi:peptide methionine sulfoxide reductase MsrA
VQVAYDPKETTFTKLLEAFAAQTDVTQLNRQGSDRGTQYRCGVYYHSEQQKADTLAYYQKLNEEIAAGKRNWAGKTVVAELKPAGSLPHTYTFCFHYEFE